MASPLIQALCHDPINFDIVEALAKSGLVDLNEKTGYGRTALMLAAWSGDDDIVKLLLDNGADVNLKDNDGWTALKFARWLKFIRIETMLKKYGAK